MQFLQVTFIAVLLCSICEILFARRKSSDTWVVDDDGCLLPDNEPGFCTSLRTCETVIYLIGDRDYHSPQAREILQEYACGVDRFGDIKVCCPYEPLNVQPTAGTFDHSHHRNLKLLPQNCGTVRAWGLFNGNEANLFEFGWSVLLKYKKDGDPVICGGSLISSRYVLTTARCVQSDYKLIGARIGEQDISTLHDCTWEYSAGKKIKRCGPPPQDFTIDERDVIVHPKYDSRTLQNNIALIRLQRGADISVESVCPICLPITQDEKMKNYDKYTAIGWGITEKGVSTHVLLKMLTENINKSVCAKTYPEVSDFSDKLMCIRGQQDQQICIEDYGGPLMGYYSKDDLYKTIQYGVVSVRFPVCKRSSFVTIYTSTIPYVGWILDNIKP